jgi:3-oxocholest-4-en-26-oyl-CoA dehydrogenase beta subunit
MDFSLNDDQESVRELSAAIISRGTSVDRLKEIEDGKIGWDRQLWGRLADAGLLGLALPSEFGGSGLGLIEVCVLLEEQGRRVSPMPLFATLILGAMPIARFGSEELRERWLPGVVSGTTILTGALVEPGGLDERHPHISARREGKAWRLSGHKLNVPYLEFADGVVVPAQVPGGVCLFVVDPHGADVRMQPVMTTDRQPSAHLHLDDTLVLESDIVGSSEGDGGEIGWLVDRAVVGHCAVQVGVAEEALRMTAEYTSQREQFGKRISTFQGVAIRAANCYVDVEVMRATMWQAAWRLATGRDASVEVEVAKWWSAEAGQRVVHECQHLHGGIGADVDYPLHRYFLWGKHAEMTYGAGARHAYQIGQLLAGS